MEVPSFVSVIPPSTLPFSPMQLFRGRAGVEDAIRAIRGLSVGQCTLPDRALLTRPSLLSSGFWLRSTGSKLRL